MRKRLLKCFLLLSLCSCEQQSLKNPSTDSRYLTNKIAPIIDSFFNQVKSDNYKMALIELFSQNENIDLHDSLTINLESKFNAINESSGKFVSQRLLRKKELADDLGVYIYLVKYEKKFYRFSFTFYNNGSSIKIYKFSFDDVIDVELEEGIKLYVN
jgi:hypothetical protein